MSIYTKSSKNIKKIRTMWESKSHEDFIHQLDLECSFIDYFVIIGLNPKICLNNFLYKNSPKDLDEYYSKEIQPEILTKFPPHKKSYTNIDDSIINLCFPNGLHLEKYNPKESHPKIMNFLLDNNFFSTDHPYKFITCLLFYEGLNNYYNLKLKIEEELKNEEDEEILKSFNTNSINETEELIDIKNIENYAIPKVICLIGIEPFYKEYEEILMQIYKYYLYNKNTSKYPLEKIVLNIIKSIPIPPYGIMEIKYKLNKNFDDILIKRHQINRINNIDEYVDYMFKIFNIDECLDIFKYTLYEIKMIVFSQHVNYLYKFIYGLINLLFPFKYPFQVSSCMLKETYNFLESISPYIFGINENYSEDLIKKNLASENTNIIIIDLDNKKIIKRLYEKLPDLPKNLRKKIKNKIKNLWKGNSLNSSKDEKNDKKEKEINEFELNENSISFIFYNSFFINVMMNYSDFINTNDLKHKNKIYNIKNLFKINDFINSHVIQEKSFYKKFVQTQMFNDFIYKKMIPKNIDEKIEILFFDECIIRKKNKMKLSVINKNTPFLKSKEFEYTQSYIIPETDPLSIEEKSKYDNTEYILNNLLNGQYIQKNKIKEDDKQNNINNNEINNDIIFNYYLFPKFDDDYFNELQDEYFSFSSYKEDIHHINCDILSKSENTNKDINHIDTNINYIYLIYIELWAYTYWYHEKIEKKYKFKQLLNIIDKISNHEIELYNLLFESLSKFNEDENILQLYDKLFSYKISPSSYIYSLINGIKKNKKDINNHNNGKFQKFKRFLSFKKKSFSKIDANMNILYKFKLRTFRSTNEFNILGERVYFETIQICSECGKKINIYNLSVNNKNIIKNELWARCPYCKVYFLPLLSVYFGNFLFNNGSNSKATRCILHCPYELKKNIKNIFKEDKSQMLDLDNFKTKYPDLFWSTVWYFYIYKIDFSFFLPYENNVNGFIKNSLFFSDIEVNIDKKVIDNNNNNNIKKNISKIKNKNIIKKNNNNSLIIQSLISINFISNKKHI